MASSAVGKLAAIKDVQANGSPQLKALIKHLIEKDGITQYEAIMVHKISALHRRISDLEKRGVDIKRTRKKDSTGRGYVKYSLA